MKSRRAHELLGVFLGTLLAISIVYIFQITSALAAFFLGFVLGFQGITIGIIIYNWRQL